MSLYQKQKIIFICKSLTTKSDFFVTSVSNVHTLFSLNKNFSNAILIIKVIWRLNFLSYHLIIQWWIQTLGGGRKAWFFVACPASFSALCDSFLFLPKVRGGPGPLPLIHHCNLIMFKAIGKTLNPRSYQPMISKYYPPNR